MGNDLFTSTEKVEDDNYSFKGTETVDDNENFFGEGSEDAAVVITGKRQNYTFQNVQDARIGGGKQSIVFVCRGDDQREYIVKLYDYKSINIEKLQDVLNLLQEEKHQNITNVLEHGDCNALGKNYYYVIMNVYKPLEKSTFQWRNQDTETYRKRILSFMDDMYEALRFIHKYDIFHGDIKPENIMLDPVTNKYVLIDFGGAARTSDNSESSVTAVAITYHYAPPEVSRNRRHINRYSDYYSLGVTLAELFDGVYPTEEDDVRRSYREVKGIYSFRIPANLPEYYENLLRGLLYQDQDENRERIKEYRWASEKVDTWLALVRRNRFEEAATRNAVPKGFVETVERATVRASQWDFGNPLHIEIGDDDDEETYTFNNLTEMADAFLSVDAWDNAVNLFLEDDPDKDPFGAVKDDVRTLIRKGIEKLQRAANSNGTGHSINAEFFKFMFKYSSDQKKFCWKDLPEVTNIGEFAVHLRAILLDRQKNNGQFGQWWTQIGENDRADYEFFAEIFRNKVLSFYLKRTQSVSKEVMQQCSKVETIFQDLKTTYSDEELTEVFLLQRMLINQNSYELPSGTTYENYNAFLTDLEEKAYDANKVHQTAEIMKSVRKKDGFYPDFLAWKKMSGR